MLATVSAVPVLIQSPPFLFFRGFLKLYAVYMPAKYQLVYSYLFLMSLSINPRIYSDVVILCRLHFSCICLCISSVIRIRIVCSLGLFDIFMECLLWVLVLYMSLCYVCGYYIYLLEYKVWHKLMSLDLVGGLTQPKAGPEKQCPPIH